MLSVHIDGRYSSIEKIEWTDIPSLAVITGLNGSGKSQLLELLAFSINERMSLGTDRQELPEGVSVNFVGEHFSPGEAFHSDSEWPVLHSSPTSEDQIRRAIQALQASRLTQPELKRLAGALNVSENDIAMSTPTEFMRLLTPNVLWASIGAESQSLSLLFLSFRYFEREARDAGESADIFSKRVGEPPWVLMREIIAAAGLPFTINEPAPLPSVKVRGNETFELKLTDERGLHVPFDQLSSGERVLMYTATWRYRADVVGRQFRLLLLDEPDAHLHPALTKRFLEVIDKVFVQSHGTRVILTTHSPTTVALVKEECLFEMRRHPPRVRKIRTAEAIARLTDGFVAVQDATRTVLVEGRSDPEFYRRVWNMLTDIPRTHQAGILEKYPNLDFVHGQGRQTVQDLVPQLRAAGFSNFLGLIDRDSGNSAKEGVFVLGRRAIENYLYDPLVVWFALNARGRAPQLGMDGERGFASIYDSTQEVWQKVIDVIAAAMSKKSSGPSACDWQRSRVQLHNGYVLEYPMWFLTARKADLRSRFSSAFVQLFQHELERAFEKGWVIPQELKDTMGLLQMGVQ